MFDILLLQTADHQQSLLKEDQHKEKNLHSSRSPRYVLLLSRRPATRNQKSQEAEKNGARDSSVEFMIFPYFFHAGGHRSGPPKSITNTHTHRKKTEKGKHQNALGSIGGNRTRYKNAGELGKKV